MGNERVLKGRGEKMREQTIMYNSIKSITSKPKFFQVRVIGKTLFIATDLKIKPQDYIKYIVIKCM